MCDLVISMPFTSTAIIAKELGKPSIFYDASASIEKNESHGIPVLKNKEETVIDLEKDPNSDEYKPKE